MLSDCKLKDNVGKRGELRPKSIIMDCHSAHNKWWIRAVAVMLTIAFINQDIVWAQEGPPVWSKQANGSFDVKTPLDSNPALPRDIALTKEAFKGIRGDNKTIINIQDAHSSLAAQESISSILDSLVTDYDLKLVAIEGSSGYIDTSILKTFPDEKIRDNTAMGLMAKGKMSAGEFYSITSNKNIALYGIEDKPLYRENLEQFRKIYEVNQAISKDMENLLTALNEIKEKVYSDELKELESNSILNKSGAVSFTDRWRYIDTLAKKLNISYSSYQNLSKLAEAIVLGISVSFDAANKERDVLIDVLSKTMTRADLEKLVLKSLSFRQGKISQGEYYLLLQGLAKDNNIDPAPYRSLIRFTDYIALYESIDLLETFEEGKILEDAIKEKLYTSSDQKRLHDTLKCANFIKDMFGLKLTNSDFEYLEANLGVCDGAVIAALIRDMSDKYDIRIGPGYDLNKIYSNIPIAAAFYRTAEKRNHAILNNTINKMNKGGQSVAALITGGYHTQGISELMKAKQVSYLVILPKFDSSKGERPYAAILTNKGENYSKEIGSGKYTALSEANIKGSIHDPDTLIRFVREIIKTNLAESKSQGKDVHAIANLWIDGYRQSYDELVKKGIIKESLVASSPAPVREDDGVAAPYAKFGDKNLATTSIFAQDKPMVSETLPPQLVESEIRAAEDEIAPAAETLQEEPFWSDPRIHASESTKKLMKELVKKHEVEVVASDGVKFVFRLRKDYIEYKIEVWQGKRRAGFFDFRSKGVFGPYGNEAHDPQGDRAAIVAQSDYTSSAAGEGVYKGIGTSLMAFAMGVAIADNMADLGEKWFKHKNSKFTAMNAEHVKQFYIGMGFKPAPDKEGDYIFNMAKDPLPSIEIKNAYIDEGGNKFNVKDPALARLIRNELLTGKRAICIAGPTGSGKSYLTDAVKKYGTSLGIKIVALELDRYFKSWDQMPRTESGQLDFDNPEALNLDWIKEDISSLLEGKKVNIPGFNMQNGSSVRHSGEMLQLGKTWRGETDTLVIDSIHALNPRILEGLGDAEVAKIFVSNSPDVRLIRRIRRDALGPRKIDPLLNIKWWDLIRDREVKFILPQAQSADYLVDSSIPGELEELRKDVAPLLERALEDARIENDEVHEKKILELFGIIGVKPGDITPQRAALLSTIGELQRTRDLLSASHARWPAAITVYGSARIPEGGPIHQTAEQFGEKAYAMGWPIRSGGNPSMGEMPLRGYIKARDASGAEKRASNATQAVYIKLPRAPLLNPYAEDACGVSDLSIRTAGLYKDSIGMVVFPGGLGTLYEVFESWLDGRPLVFIGKEYWDPILDKFFISWEKAGLLKSIERPFVTDSPDEAIAYLDAHKAVSAKYDKASTEKANNEIKSALLKEADWAPGVTFFGEPGADSAELAIAKDLLVKIVSAGMPVCAGSRGVLLDNMNEVAASLNKMQLLRAALLVPEGGRLTETEDLLADKITVNDVANHNIICEEHQTNAFVFLPGGVATMSSLFGIYVSMAIGEIPARPIILVGREFWTPIKEAVELAATLNLSELIDKKALELIKVVDDPEEALTLLNPARDTGDAPDTSQGKGQRIEERGLAVTSVVSALLAAGSAFVGIATRDVSWLPALFGIVTATFILHGFISSAVLLWIVRASANRTGPIAETITLPNKQKYIVVRPEFHTLPPFVRGLILLHEHTHALGLNEFFAYGFPLIGLFAGKIPVYTKMDEARLKKELGSYERLAENHSTGWLRLNIPRWSTVGAIQQWGPHPDTVEEHTMGNIKALHEAGILQNLPHPEDMLIMSFFHDFGKDPKFAYMLDRHSLEGSQIVEPILISLGMSEAEAKRYSWYVKHHGVIYYLAYGGEQNNIIEDEDAAYILNKITAEEIEMLTYFNLAEHVQIRGMKITDIPVVNKAHYEWLMDTANRMKHIAGEKDRQIKTRLINEFIALMAEKRKSIRLQARSTKSPATKAELESGAVELLLMKPDAIALPRDASAEYTIEHWLKLRGFEILYVGAPRQINDEAFWGKFYHMLKGKLFFKWLTAEYMSSGPVRPIIVRHRATNAVNFLVKHAGELRKALGIESVLPIGDKNKLHRSDSVNNVKREVALLLPREEAAKVFDSDALNVIYGQIPGPGQVPNKLLPFAIGLQPCAARAETDARKAVIKEALGDNCEIVMAESVAEFASLGRVGIYIDNTIPDPCILEAVTVAMSRINSGQAEKLAKLIEKIIGPIESVKPAEIFALAQNKLAENTPTQAMLAELKSSVEEQREALAAYFNKTAQGLDATVHRLNPKVKLEAQIQEGAVVSAVTDTVAVEDPTFRESIIRNRANGLKTVLIYGGVFLTVKEVEAFVGALGINMADIEFVYGRDDQGKMLKHDELINKIQNKFPSVKAEYIGIRAAEEEVKPQDEVTKGKLLLVKRAEVNGMSILLAMNSEKILLNLILAGANAGELKIPGLAYDDTRKIFIFTPIVPIDYGKEIGTYRNAMLLLSRAA